MDAKLYLVNAVGEAEDGEVGAFDRGDSFVALAISQISLIVRGDWDEVSELLGS